MICGRMSRLYYFEKGERGKQMESFLIMTINKKEWNVQKASMYVCGTEMMYVSL